MEIQVFAVVVLVLGMLALNVESHWSMYILVVSWLFAAAATLTVGGITLPPETLFLIFLFIRAFNMGGPAGLWRPLAPGSPGFPLVWLAVVALIGAWFLPRAFAGATNVFAISKDAADPNAVGPVPLAPVSGNLTQSVYFISDVVIYCCMTIFLARKDGYRHLALAMLVLAGLNVVAGVVDMVGGAVGINALGWIKTAGYTIHDGEEVGGLRRITGTFTEASTYAGFTMQLFAFTANMWLFGYRPRLTGLIALASVVLIMLSTSTTAYVGMVAYLMVLLCSRDDRIWPHARARKGYLFAAVGCLAILALLFSLIFKPGMLESVLGFFNDTVMAKADSDSGRERGSWNQQAITNIIDTYGFGIGLGSARTSSFVLALLSNLGFAGAVLFGVFAWNCLVARIPVQAPLLSRMVCHSMRQAMFAALIMCSIAGTMFNLGSNFYVFAAATTALSLTARRMAPSRRVNGASDGDVPLVAPAPRRQTRMSPKASGKAAHLSLVESGKRRSRVPAWPNKG
ncbi:O-antigen ligase family protein [Paraburkholderia rhizosphaerae]|uniref:O-antigen ligase-like membrane protein n=1 Tax=Paraburkholderia rhizosphaerae TaxID=480658 RepID=A0A4R8M4E3_9BURK|nr:O-antigen ligase family protein [Paraburkholderia rhizosphaerae]TDY54891.1 O-antigen ligase-like membrane protein [Paraburkholderia rhizosphaerae]